MNLKGNFTLTQIEYVVAVHKYGHFAKAAEACHVTQPTLSMQIQKLEADLGVVIFDRTKKPIILTDMGQKIIEQFQTILFETKKIEHLLEPSQQGQIHGELKLGVIPTVAPYLIPNLLPLLQKNLPHLKLNMKELQTHQIIEALQNDEIDVGLLATPLQQSKIKEYPLFYEPFSVYCQKDHELAANKKLSHHKLKFEDIWLLEEGHCLRNQIIDICEIKNTQIPPRNFKFESGSLETLKKIVETYGGYTLLPALAVDSKNIAKNSSTTVIPFDRPIPAREIGLVYLREHYKNDLIEALGQAILQSLPEEIRKVRTKDLEVIPITNANQGPSKD